MIETLYPHEQIVKKLKEPNTTFDAISWLLFSYPMMVIQIFIVCAFAKFANDISIFIAYGMNICCVLTIILGTIGVIGFAQSMESY
jgi:hypothetical protein